MRQRPVQVVIRTGNHAVHDSDVRVSSAAAREALGRILASEAFVASPRKSRFLSYVVEQTLAGRGGHITAYDIAVQVFERDERFDPQTDPLVRIAARRSSLSQQASQLEPTLSRSEPSGATTMVRVEWLPPAG